MKNISQETYRKRQQQIIAEFRHQLRYANTDLERQSLIARIDFWRRYRP
ncbi:MAG: hypothetical protein F6K42_20865 [Leptolyngbya sp. SIO1D8]|nr:hypothetical protein [Leptolyngbya sp. SIO1D8]